MRLDSTDIKLLICGIDAVEGNASVFAGALARISGYDYSNNLKYGAVIDMVRRRLAMIKAGLYALDEIQYRNKVKIDIRKFLKEDKK